MVMLIVSATKGFYPFRTNNSEATIKFRDRETPMKQPSNLGDGKTIKQSSNLDMEKQHCNPRGWR